MNNIAPSQQHLALNICENAQDVIAKGFKYEAQEYKALKCNQVVVVKYGTVSNKPTVDFIFEDETGQKFVFMVTGALIKTIPCRYDCNTCYLHLCWSVGRGDSVTIANIPMPNLKICEREAIKTKKLVAGIAKEVITLCLDTQ